MQQKLDDFLQFLTSIQSLANLRSLEFNWPSKIKYFWDRFKPQSSLRYLKLSLNGSDLIREELFEGDVDPLGNWEFIQELDELEFFVFSCKDQKEMNLVNLFITIVLNKVCKLRSLKCSIYGGRDTSVTYEPFFVEEVPHLYESLESFEHNLYNRKSSKFDLKIMEPFRNLKVLKLDGDAISYENIEDAVSLLEGNQKEGDFSTFQLKLVDSGLLKETLVQIQKAKKKESDFKIMITVKFQTSHLVGLFERLCDEIQSVKTIKGLVLDLYLSDKGSSSPISAMEVKEVLRKYHRIRNIRVLLSNCGGFLTFIKVDGEKEQFFVDFDAY